MHKLLCALILAAPLSAMDSTSLSELRRTGLIKVDSIRAPSELGNVELYRNHDGFSIKHDGYTHQVPHYNIDNGLKQIKPEHLAALGKVGYVRINRLSDGGFKLDLRGRINGGGPGGAVVGAWVGKFVGYTIGCGILSLVNIAMGPAQPLAGPPTALMAAGAIETFALKCAIAGGVIGSVITGPA